MQKSKAKAKPKSPAASVKAKSSPSKPNPGQQKATKSKSVLQTGSKMKKPAAARKRPAAALGEILMAELSQALPLRLVRTVMEVLNQVMILVLLLCSSAQLLLLQR